MTTHVHMQETQARTDGPAEAWSVRLPLILGLWGGGVALLAGLGLVEALPRELFGALAVIGVAVPVAVYSSVPSLRAYIAGKGLRWLTAFHLWRIGAAALFLHHGANGALPELFVQRAAWGDLIAGLLVIPVLLLPERGIGKYIVFHTVGFADFVLAVGTGITLVLLGDPAMATLTALPLALIPLFGVGVSGASHLIAFDLMRRNSRAEAQAGTFG